MLVFRRVRLRRISILGRTAYIADNGFTESGPADFSAVNA
jgi:hypothetical protein